MAAGPQEVGEILDPICSEIGADYGFARTVIVRLVDDETIRVVAQDGVPDADRQSVPLAAFPLLERALAANRAVLVPDVKAERAVPPPVAERFGILSAVAVPLLSEGRCLGFVAADGGDQVLDLSETKLGLLTALGVVAGVMIDKAQQYEQLQAALEELRHLDQVKSEFISIASHELRTPIAVVCGIAATLHLRGDELAGDQRHELRETLYEHTQRLRELTEQLLDLSRIDSGSVHLRTERFRPRESFDSLLPRICPDRIDDIEVAIDPALELETDPSAFERVVSNLVTNALRYGRPPVSVEADANGGCCIVVEDRGDGVSPEFVPRLFDRFTRCEQSLSREGAGLGLAIARSYAEALGGELHYENAQPRGARFVFVLPRG